MKTEIPNALSAEVLDSYDIVGNTFTQLVKDNPKDEIKIEIGDVKQPDFKPQVKIQRWSNEVNFSMRAQEHPDAIVETEGNKIKYITPEYEVHQYDKPEAGEDGGLEFEWILPSKPSSNVLTATIQTKGLDFFYQPELTQDEIDQGSVRPENVVGSYAVYHATKGGMNRADGMEYKVGKAFHIYRPKVTDANGDEIWGELNIDVDNGFLTVTIDQSFLDNAIYPVIVDPTFGYTSIGATTTSTSGNNAQAWLYVAPENGTVTSITAYDKASATTKNGKLAIWNDDATFTLLTNSISAPFTRTTTAGWHEESVSSPSVVGSTNYYLGVVAETSSITTNIDATGGTRKYDATNSYATPQDMGTPTDASTKGSIYATYTASGGGTPVSGPSMTTNTGFWGS